uniref:Ubiquitin carboxyl-terminal hydrolase 13 n=1 Tax=Aotus nancymaae TaxID=37293 RepID=A0A2K5DVF1_AOTNA
MGTARGPYIFNLQYRFVPRSCSDRDPSCRYCRYTPAENSEGGLYVCMNTFLAFEREHAERHFRKTGQSVYMHLKRLVREKVRGASGGALPKRRNSKIFLDLDTDDDLNSDDYEYEDEAKLVIFPDHYEIALPNIEELPALVSECARRLARCAGWKCARCDLQENLWLNLTDGSVLCGKWFFDSSGGNGHALEHYRDMGYPLAVKLGTITPDGADVYSFQEEEPVSDPHLAKHLAHFGIDMLHMHGTENGLQDNEIKPRVSEWEVIQESGTKLKPMYGPGYTGLKNLGNSCYLNSVMQANFSIPEFQRAYAGNLPRIFDYSPLDPTQDFNKQMTKLGHGLLSGQFSKPPVKSELIEQVMKEEHKLQHNGISPRMFKAFVTKSHPEFSSNRQQDAQEFFLHLVNLVERNRVGSENPSDVFRFLVEERIQCCQTRKVRYTERVGYLMQRGGLTVQMNIVDPKSLAESDLLGREKEKNRERERESSHAAVGEDPRKESV